MPDPADVNPPISPSTPAENPVPGVGWLAYIKDPDGNIVGLLEPDETAPVPGETAPAPGETAPAPGETAPARGETAPAPGETEA